MAVQFYSSSTQSRPERKDVTEQIELRKKQQAEADRKVKAERAEESVGTQR